MDQKKLLYVEDDVVIRNNFSEFFLANGYSVFAVDCDDKAKHLISSRSDFDCAVFDVELSYNPFAGIELSRYFREQFPRIPIIMLSAHTDTDLQEMAYSVGVDAYIDKREPLSLISARLDGLVRRYNEILVTTDLSNALGESSFGLELDHHAKLATWSGQELALNPVRFDILVNLHEAQGRSVSIFDIQKALNIVCEANTIVQHVKIIRGEFKRIDDEFDCIRTVRGKGYRWVSP